MDTITFINNGLESSKGWFLGLLDDLKNDLLVQPTDKGGNHPLWILGHIAYGEGMLLDMFIKGENNRYAEWDNLFGPGSTPVTDASAYPDFKTLMTEFDEVRSASLAHLKSLSLEDLNNASKAPEEHADGLFGTVGGCFGAMISHVNFHAGQLADCRRALGRGPLFM